MVLNVHRNRKAYLGRGEGGGWGRVWGGGKREIIYLLQHCDHQNDSCIKMGSDESPRRVSLYVYIIICIVMSNFRPHSVCYWLSPLPVIFVNLHITCHSDSLVCPSLAGRSANGRLTNTNWYALFIVILLGFTIHTRCSGLAKELSLIHISEPTRRA